VSWQLVFTSHARKDAKRLAAAGLKKKAEELFAILKEDPYRVPPQFEKMHGELKGAYARRINKHNRLVYQILDDEKVVKALRMWTHYE
jgi:Txe/YoeB family toxin of toxin-antitoxin system